MRLPAGVRDWLPPELRRKRAVEAELRSVFERWAYAEVQTPALERRDVLEAGVGPHRASRTFSLPDRDGSELALRPEMTTPIARLVATRMRGASLPLRLAYVQNAFRAEEPQEGRLREFTQAGIELIGPESADADAEALFTAVEALDALGLGDARFDVNDVAIVDGALAGLALAPADVARAKGLIANRNVVALRALLTACDRVAASDDLVRLVMTRGRDETLALARAQSHTPAGRAGIARLERLLVRADELGFGDRLGVDPALLRNFEYYTGIVFEGFVPEVGFALCGGGRYDALLPAFGFEAGAVGWSANVERLLIALERRGSRTFGAAPAVDVLVSGSDVAAARERAAGRIVRIDFERTDEAGLIAEARAHRIPRVLVVDGDRTREIDLAALDAAESRP